MKLTPSLTLYTTHEVERCLIPKELYFLEKAPLSPGSPFASSFSYPWIFSMKYAITRIYRSTVSIRQAKRRREVRARRTLWTWLFSRPHQFPTVTLASFALPGICYFGCTKANFRSNVSHPFSSRMQALGDYANFHECTVRIVLHVSFNISLMTQHRAANHSQRQVALICTLLNTS